MKTHNTLSDIQSKLKAPKGQFNSFGKYSYRSTEDIMSALKPLLAEHQVSVTVSDEVVEVGSRIYIKATATLHGEEDSIFTTAYAREEESKKGMDASQLSGACSSYARKYALSGLFCIDDNADADADSHNEKTEPEPKRNKSITESTPRISQNKYPASEAQLKFLKSLLAERGISESTEGLSNKEASERITELKEMPVGEAKKEPKVVEQESLPLGAEDDVPF